MIGSSRLYLGYFPRIAFMVVDSLKALFLNGYFVVTTELEKISMTVS